MEWLELLKMLSEQQSDAVTQQQIDALRAGLQAARLENLNMGICFLVLIAGLVVAVYFLNRACERRIKKLEAGLKLQAAKHSDVLELIGVIRSNFISNADSINSHKSDVAG